MLHPKGGNLTFRISDLLGVESLGRILPWASQAPWRRGFRRSPSTASAFTSPRGSFSGGRAGIFGPRGAADVCRALKTQVGLAGFSYEAGQERPAAADQQIRCELLLRSVPHTHPTTTAGGRIRCCIKRGLGFHPEVPSLGRPHSPGCLSPQSSADSAPPWAAQAICKPTLSRHSLPGPPRPMRNLPGCTAWRPGPPHLIFVASGPCSRPPEPQVSGLQRPRCFWTQLYVSALPAPPRASSLRAWLSSPPPQTLPGPPSGLAVSLAT